MSHRIVASVVSLALFVNFGAASPALGMSTHAEIAQSTKIDQEVVAQEGVVRDPLLNRWTRAIAQRLWVGVQRKDLPYSIKILDSSDVNAFTTGGGYIYLDEGTLDTVASDDELASVIGHETGHDERRHPITLRQRGELLNLVFGIASILSPVFLGLGSVLGEGLLAKQSRTDELQADAYGLHLMTQAGYDPAAMVSFMRRLEQLEGSDDSQVDGYLADHPGLADRIRHLEQKPELKQESSVLQRARAEHDARSARYAVAAERYRRLLQIAKDPDVSLRLGRLEVALGQPAHAAQDARDAFLAPVLDAQQRSAAKALLAELAVDERMRDELQQPALASYRAAVLALRQHCRATSSALADHRDRGRAKLASLQTRLHNLSDAAPELGTDDASERLGRDIAALGHEVNATLDRVTQVDTGIGSLAHGRESGLLADSYEMSDELAAPLQNDTVPSDALTLLPWYPEMANQLQAANTQLAAAADTAYTALLQVDHGLDVFERLLAAGGSGADASTMTKEREQWVPRVQAALAPAFESAQQAARSYNLARVRQLEVRLTLLNLGSSADRYASLVTALDQRLGGTTPNYMQWSRMHISIGELIARRIAATDVGVGNLLVPVSAGGSIADSSAEARWHYDSEAEEIFLGLTYCDYTDDSARGKAV